MNEQLISFETAKLAKEKGFKEPVLYHYWRINGDESDFEKNPKPNSELIREVDTVMSHDDGKNGCEVSIEMLDRNYLWDDDHPILGECKSFIAVPTQSLLQRWLREVYNIHIVVYIFKPEDKNKYCCDIVSDIFKENLEDDQSFDTYEEALEQALYQALQLIK